MCYIHSMNNTKHDSTGAMPRGKRTIQLIIRPEEAPGHLRSLAAQMEQGTIELGGKHVELTGCENFSVGFKHTDEGLRMRVRIKFPKQHDACTECDAGTEGFSASADDDADEDPDPEPRYQFWQDSSEDTGTDDEADDRFGNGFELLGGSFPRSDYGSFKKWLSRVFRDLEKQARRGHFPNAAECRVLLEACVFMTEMDGRGSEFFPAFLAEVKSFAAAAHRGDHTAARHALETLDAQRRQCHSKYK